MFRAALDRLGDDDSSGHVLVFASAGRFPAIHRWSAGAISAPGRRSTCRDLTVAAIPPSVNRRGAWFSAAQAVRGFGCRGPRGVKRPDQAAILPGLVLDTSAVAPATAAQFRAAGLTHPTAVS